MASSEMIAIAESEREAERHYPRARENRDGIVEYCLIRAQIRTLRAISDAIIVPSLEFVASASRPCLGCTKII